MQQIRYSLAAAAIMSIPALAVSALMLLNTATASDTCYKVGSAQPNCTKKIGPIAPRKTDKDGKDLNSYWIDTDGENPGVAGCHIEVSGPTNSTPLPGGRVFGEFCETDNILVESNPEANKIHMHTNDIGSPYLINCDKWCKAGDPPKQAKAAGGSCKGNIPVSVTISSQTITCQSARCECK